METSQLFEGEKIILFSNDKTVTLTSRRIRQDYVASNGNEFMSMHLENISTIEVSSKHSLILLLIGLFIGVVGVAVGVAKNEVGLLVAGIVLCGLFILIYFLTKTHEVSICSDGGSKMNFSINGMKREAALEFINKIEHAKNQIK